MRMRAASLKKRNPLQVEVLLEALLGVIECSTVLCSRSAAGCMARAFGEHSGSWKAQGTYLSTENPMHQPCHDFVAATRQRHSED